jgi:excisionase family DNA binding protein
MMAAMPTDDAPAGELVSIGEAARMLGLSDQVVRRRSETGQIPCIRPWPGAHRRYRRSDLEALLRVSGARRPARATPAEEETPVPDTSLQSWFDRGQNRESGGSESEQTGYSTAAAGEYDPPSPN